MIDKFLKTALAAAVMSFALHGEAISNKTYGSAVVTEVTSIYDGDTFRANLKGYPAIIGERIGIRINGIDTPSRSWAFVPTRSI